ncbi:hypothetical protein JKP28_21230 [Vibrio vulnificus]|uniref:hypothetical protein n=1 Tax=Vibrio TaxID=662 RepID=UPI000A2028FA|nr:MULTISPECIES: hypothetical protein [Vibrio]ARN66115.1 hypothetical protein FORC36_1598 [Vibrio vulnificus]EID4426143.1 hypothetical protein [Vibrio vulnificus]MBE3658919.1 hypothetical protein [Vibrio navarrensis]MCA3962560.1 hypothetical protein [Vibrio vulnificus]MCG6299640.1 hypothetical protein [Vibrio vulnificus]
MELSEYVETSIYSVLKGLRQADRRIFAEGMGKIWKSDFNTISTDLVGLKIAKGQGEEGEPSIPVLVFDFDINVTVSESQGNHSSVAASAGAKVLNVITFKGGVDAGSNKTSNQLATQNLKFSVPVHFGG